MHVISENVTHIQMDSESVSFHSQMSIRGGAKTGKALLITAAVLLSVGIVLLIVMMLMKPPSEPAVVTASPKAKRNSRMAVELSSEQEARDALASSAPAMVFLYAD